MRLLANDEIYTVQGSGLLTDTLFEMQKVFFTELLRVSIIAVSASTGLVGGCLIGGATMDYFYGKKAIPTGNFIGAFIGLTLVPVSLNTIANYLFNTDFS